MSFDNSLDEAIAIMLPNRIAPEVGSALWFKCLMIKYGMRVNKCLSGSVKNETAMQPELKLREHYRNGDDGIGLSMLARWKKRKNITDDNDDSLASERMLKSAEGFEEI